jgi:two-component system nitrate/nitrite response regulator NarL
MKQARVLVADPLPIFRTGVRSLLRRESDFDVVEVGSLDELEQLDELPDIALIDAELPPRGALAVIAWLSERCDAAAIVWSYDPRRDHVLDSIRAGACGYLRKEISGAGLMRALHGAVQGEAPLSRELATLMVEALHGLEERDRARARLGLLSPRERQVLDLIAGGAHTRTIATTLAISEFTVKRHVQNILQKLQLRSRAAAATFYRAAADAPEVIAARLA